ncbi:MAG: septum formation initiator family protein [Treponema sp.]|jgi:cell division protein FtsB|nr:septum formation initiator family protein [Treponema sp.]
MRLLRYMLVPWTAILVYTFFSFFLGQNGLYAQKYLETERLRLLENQKALEQTKNDFLKTKRNLINDRDTLSVYARQLGYGAVDEKFIRIKGLSVAVNADMPVGKVVYAANPEFISDTAIKIISAFFALAVLVFFLIRDLLLSD